MNEKKRKMKEC